MNNRHWINLKKYSKEKKIILNDEFFKNHDRFDCFSKSGPNVFLDFSKNIIDEDIFSELMALLKSSDFFSLRENMFAGKKINNTERRAVSHVALRSLSKKYMSVEEVDVVPDVRIELYKIACFVDAVRSGEWLGYTGLPIKDVVNIGIGGSDLGPKMAVEALKPYQHKSINMHFVSNVDSTQLYDVLHKCQAQTTLFIICSKSFTTLETLRNAALVKQWFFSRGGRQVDVNKHFCAVTANACEATKFGINVEQQFSMWPWVGGRFSLWSSIGVSIAISIGMNNFIEMLEGAEQMDEHFYTAPPEDNLPIILALMGIWYINFKDSHSHAVLPYFDCLKYFPEYLQQLDMESNGKCVNKAGEITDLLTSPVIWGTAGTNGQHAYFQFLHQGEQLISSDFILVKKTNAPSQSSHKVLLANAIAQMESLMKGKSRGQALSEMKQSGATDLEIKSLLSHKIFPGNRPSNAIILDSLTPRALGSLVSLYEHKIFTQGAIWGVNSFDQWGVEYGKNLAISIIDEIEGKVLPHKHDESTSHLMKMVFD